jgi:UDP-N-acetylmuramoylalanine-D-glutamate ligase
LSRVERFLAARGAHSLQNLLAALLAVKLYAPEIKITEKDILALENPKMRQEQVYADKHAIIVNDSCATSPDGVAAVIARFGKDPTRKLFLIAGGTDKQLDYSGLARDIKKTLPPAQLILLEGTGTTKLLGELAKLKYTKQTLPVFSTLEDCVLFARATIAQLPAKEKVSLVFSPGGSSFEKFLHEFARGDAFNALIKKHWK